MAKERRLVVAPPQDQPVTPATRPSAHNPVGEAISGDDFDRGRTLRDAQRIVHGSCICGHEQCRRTAPSLIPASSRLSSIARRGGSRGLISATAEVLGVSTRTPCKGVPNGQAACSKNRTDDHRKNARDGRKGPQPSQVAEPAVWHAGEFGAR
jgi:hypothetical protein